MTQTDIYTTFVASALTDPFQHLHHMLRWAKNHNKSIDKRWYLVEEELPEVRYWRTEKHYQGCPKEFICLELVTDTKHYIISLFANKRIFFIINTKNYFINESVRKGDKYIKRLKKE